MKSREILERTIAAHGGRDRWKDVEAIEAKLSSDGFAFTTKFQASALSDLAVAVHPKAGRVVLKGFGGEGRTGQWTPGLVQIVDEQGKIVRERRDPRREFGKIRKNLWWDKLDILYFAGYALWNYLSFPFILDLPGVALAEEAGTSAYGGARLDVTFDSSFPTHSAGQRFHLDEKHRLVRHDYTADVIGRWAKAANMCLASIEVDGLRFYTRRRVYPTLGHEIVLPFPTLVRIELDDLKVSRSR